MKALLFYVLLPLLVFCFSKSKLPPYIMPFYGTAALLVVYSFREFHSNWDDRITFAILLLLAAGIGITGFVWPPLEHLRWPLACAGLVALLVCLASYRLRAKDWGQRAAPLLMLGISVVAYLTLPSLQDEMKGYRPMAMKMNEHDPQRQVPTVIYKGFLPSISFYRQELAVMALGRARETMFEGNDQYRQWHVETDAELQEKVAPLPRVFVVSEPHDIGAFSASTSFACNVLLAQKRYTAYDCSSGSAETTPAAR